MPITYPLALPSPGIAQAVVRMISTTSVTESPFTGQVQAQSFARKMWEFEFVYPTMARANAEAVIAFLAKLDGRLGTFLAGDPAAATPRGSASSAPGTPLVMGASQTGVDLNFDGAPAGASGYLLEGDYIGLGTGVNTHLHKVLDDVNIDSAGEGTMTIWPALRESPADNAAITVSSAKGHFRLAENVSEFSIDTAIHYGISFLAREDIQVV